MKDEKRSSLRFLFHAVAFSLLFMAFMFTLRPYMDFEDPRRAEIGRLQGQILSVAPEQLPQLVTGTEGKPVMLVLYASWCGTCRVILPDIVQLVHDGSLSAVEPIFLSVDHEPRDLSRYLVHSGLDKAFILLRANEGVLTRLTDSLPPLGSSYKGNIPYIAFFKEGRVVGELYGKVEREGLMQAVARIVREGRRS